MGHQSSTLPRPRLLGFRNPWSLNRSCAFVRLTSWRC